MKHLQQWIKSGSPWVWLTAGAVSVCLLMVVGVMALIAVRGLVYFWPADVIAFEYRTPDGSVKRVAGEIYGEEDLPAARLREAGITIDADRERVKRYLIKVGNRDIYGSDFVLLIEPFIESRSVPEDVMVVERREWGNFYGFLKEVKENGEVVAAGDEARAELQRRLDRVKTLHTEIEHIEKDEIGAINYRIERLRLDERRLELQGITDPARHQALADQRAQLQSEYEQLQQRLSELYTRIGRDSFSAMTRDGNEADIPLANVVRIHRPNEMGLIAKIGFYFAKMWEFVSEDPREANTEGGIFPAIFGTVMMVMIMSVIVTPFGIVAAVYLREYARQGAMVRTIRIAVNNLAGVPSIVYGVFGLGFFVYFIGGSIDQLFYPEALPSPTFGAPGILWASLTLAILTLPVVIVSTEEGLSRIPRSIREGSLALGATKAETLWRTILPMASPAMMTGLILAVARAAGEVAPLMLVGVVKLAPSLPLDGNYPFLHLDRKFMHLGFHIYDVGFQSPNVEAARPLVYATALLLVLVIVALNLAAIGIRNHLREKYRSLEAG